MTAHPRRPIESLDDPRLDWVLVEAHRDNLRAYLAIKPRMRELFRDVAAVTYVAPHEIPLDRFRTEVVDARWVTAYVLREAGLSQPQIAWLLRRNASTIHHGLRRIEERPDLLALTPPLVRKYAVTHPTSRVS